MSEGPAPRGLRDARTAPAPASANRLQPPPPAFGLESLIALAVGIAVVASLYFASAVLIPVTLAILLSFLLAPLVNLLGRLRLGHVASVFAAVVMSVSVIGLLGAVIGTQLSDLAAGMPRYQATIERKMESAHRLTVGRLDRFAGMAGQALQRATVEPPPGPPRDKTAATSAGNPQASGTATAVPVEVREPMPTPFEMVRRLLSPAISPLETAFIVFVVTVVILLQRDDLRDRALRLFGSRDLHRATTVMDEAARRLSRYFVSQLGLNAGLGLVIGLGLFLIGVPSPILWGILAALLRLVPYVGIWISAALATALAAAVSPGWSMALWSLALFVSVELIAGQVVEPLLYGRSTGLSPFSVVVAAIFWSWIWGPIGLILSTPLTLCLLVLGRHVRRLEFLDVLLGDQPALTPVENFYQRALAGDPDEAIEQAEILLRDRSLCTYYDEVAIKGLQLAANDVARGSVTAVQLARIEATTNDLVDGLDSYEDREPPPRVIEDDWSPTGPAASAGSADTDGDADASGARESGAAAREAVPSLEESAAIAASRRVLCIPGRGSLDPLAATILLQLLGKHGFPTRALPHEAVSRASIESLDAADVSVVCVLYLQVDGVPSHLRHLIKRIRVRLPQATIVVGLWNPQQTEQKNAELKSALGDAGYATSLRDILTACGRTKAPADQAELALVND